MKKKVLYTQDEKKELYRYADSVLEENARLKKRVAQLLTDEHSLLLDRIDHLGEDFVNKHPECIHEMLLLLEFDKSGTPRRGLWGEDDFLANGSLIIGAYLVDRESPGRKSPQMEKTHFEKKCEEAGFREDPVSGINDIQLFIDIVEGYLEED